MRALILGRKEIADLYELRKRAEATPVSIAQTLRSNGGDKKGLTIYAIRIPDGYEVSLTMDEQLEGHCRHGGFRIVQEGEVGPKTEFPSHAAVDLLMAYLGFRKPLKQSERIWTEGGIVNVAQLELAE